MSREWHQKLLVTPVGELMTTKAVGEKDNLPSLVWLGHGFHGPPSGSEVTSTVNARSKKLC